MPGDEGSLRFCEEVIPMQTRYRHLNHEEFLRMAGGEATTDLERELVNRMTHLLNLFDMLECDLQEAERVLAEEGFAAQESLIQ